MSEPKSDAELGDPAYGSDAPSVTYEAGEAISAGDAVGINGGQLATADGTTDTTVVGIAGDDATSGENVTVYTGGAIVANVGGTVAAGEQVTVSATEGQLAAGAGDIDIVALTDAGAVSGLSAGYGLGTNAAVVRL